MSNRQHLDSFLVQPFLLLIVKGLIFWEKHWDGRGRPSYVPNEVEYLRETLKWSVGTCRLLVSITGSEKTSMLLHKGFYNPADLVWLRRGPGVCVWGGGWPQGLVTQAVNSGALVAAVESQQPRDKVHRRPDLPRSFCLVVSPAKTKKHWSSQLCDVNPRNCAFFSVMGFVEIMKITGSWTCSQCV